MRSIDEAIKQNTKDISASSQSNGPGTQIGAEEFGSVDQLSLIHSGKSRLVFHSDPGSLAAEQLRFLRLTLEQKFPAGAILLVTSPASNDGKTLTTFNLGACLANSCRSTLLLECDTRRPSFLKYLAGKRTIPGIEEALAGTIGYKKVIHFVPDLSLYVGLVSEPPRDPSLLVSGNNTNQFLTWAKKSFHWVVLDSPPVVPAMDTAHLATLADATLLVVRAGSTPRELTTRAVELLGSCLFGVILNEATIKSNPYYRFLNEYRRNKSVLANCATAANSNNQQRESATSRAISRIYEFWVPKPVMRVK